jgi:hypothetical protein
MSPKRRRIYTKIHSEHYEIAIKLLLLLKLSSFLVSGAIVRLVSILAKEVYLSKYHAFPSQ